MINLRLQKVSNILYCSDSRVTTGGASTIRTVKKHILRRHLGIRIRIINSPHRDGPLCMKLAANVFPIVRNHSLARNVYRSRFASYVLRVVDRDVRVI